MDRRSFAVGIRGVPVLAGARIWYLENAGSVGQ